jgi:hypothetical protein
VIPQTFGALLAFLGLVAPGIVFQMMRERARPATEETAFREASRVTLTSLLFTLLSFAVLVGLWKVKPSWLANIEQWLKPKSDYGRTHIALIAWSMGLELAIACILAGLASLVLNRLHAGKVIKRSLWYQVLKEERPASEVTWAHLEVIGRYPIVGICQVVHCRAEAERS